MSTDLHVIFKSVGVAIAPFAHRWLHTWLHTWLWPIPIMIVNEFSRTEQLIMH